MSDTANDLLHRFADRYGLTAEQVRFLRRVVRLARRERSAAVLRRVRGRGHHGERVELGGVVMHGFFQWLFGMVCLLPWLLLAAALNWLLGRPGDGER